MDRSKGPSCSVAVLVWLENQRRSRARPPLLCCSNRRPSDRCRVAEGIVDRVAEESHRFEKKVELGAAAGPAKVLVAGNRPELTARQTADFDCPDSLAASLRFNIGRPSRQVICR